MHRHASPGSSGAMNGSGGSITELLGALCDTCLSGVSWRKRAVGATSPDAVRRILRRRAYGALLAKLFQQGSPKPPCARSPAAVVPPRNKVFMISFDLRLSGCQEEAEKLEELLLKLGDGSTSGLGELDSVLELLVQLAGSVPPPPASFHRDYMRRERPVLRRPPLTGYHSKELQQLEARAWALVCREEWGALGSQQRTLGLMDGLPGTGLLTLGRWPNEEDRFERETRLSLFGALQNTRTADLDIRLDLPPVPSNIEVTGLAIRVPPAFDQSEDEGFQSASNLTPDSQSEPSPSPEVDVWEALRNFEPSLRRCWENVGWPPGKKEHPYLTEAGREAFDHLYRLREGEMRVVCSDISALPPTPVHSQKQLVADFLNVLIGVTSDTFPLNQASVQFEVRPGMCISGASPESISCLLMELAQYGTHYLRLNRFSLQSAHQRGLVFQAFTGGLRRYLQYYRACVLSTPPSFSLLTIGFLFRKLGRQLRYLSELCCVHGNAAVGQTPFPVGVRLLSYLYNEALSNCSNENYPVLLSLLKSSCEPYTRFVSDWVYSGVFRDVYKEFMIQVNEDYLSYRDKHFWVQGYTLISQDVEECVPVFLRHIANDVYVCGKTINLLKICCPQHYICWSELPVPRIAVTFSMQEVEEIERDCAVYRGRMERIAKHSTLSREEQILRTEQTRQELISHVRESTAKTLETIRGHQVSQRLAQEAKKRELFQEIKHHLEQEREWRSAAKHKEQEDDFSFAREVRDREKRLQALEEQLEHRTKKELIAQYSRMSEEAARRERRAVWRVHRLRLDEARTEFLEEDQRLIQALLKIYPLGQGRKPLEYPPPSVTPQGTQVPEAPTGVYDRLQNVCDGLPATSSLHPSSLPPLHKTSVCSRSSDSHVVDQLDLTHFEPKSPRLSSNSQVDRALQDIGSELSEGNNASVKDDYDFSAPYSPLQESVARARWGPTVQPSFTCLTEQSRDLHVQGSEHLFPKAQSEDVPGLQTQSSEEVGLDNGIDFQASGALQESKLQEFLPEQGAVNTGHGEEPGHKASLLGVQPETPLDVSITVVGSAEAEQVPVLSTHVKSVLHEEAGTTTPSGHGTAPGKSVEEGTVDSTSLCPILNQHRNSLDCTRMENRVLGMEISSPGVECVDLGSELSQMQFPGSSHGHASDSSLIVGCVVSGTEPIQKTLSSRSYGSASDSTLELGCVVSGTEPVQKPLPGSSYGHASDSTLGVGCVVSGTEPIQRPLPGSNYGHASDSTLQVGCVFSGIEPVKKPLPGSSYGHASDSTLGVGCVVSGTEPIQRPLPGSAYGHASDSTLQVGCVFSGPEPVQKPLPGSSYGHASDSTLGVGCVVSGTEPIQRPLPGSSYGHASDSTLGVGCVVSVNLIQAPLPGSAYGHSSDSALGVGCIVKSTLNCLSESETLDTTIQKPSEDQVHEESSENKEAKGQVPGSEVRTPDGPRDLVESSSAWVKASDIQPGVRTEQDYLHSLAAQYEVEQYQDDYRILTAAPDSQLLQQVTRSPYGFPGSGDLRHATDTTAVHLSEMVSLPVLIKHSVTTPLSTHVSLVNKAVVDYFFVELGVERHFEALRHFLLMEDGEFAQSLSDLLFEKLASGQTPGELLTPLVLNSILSKALQYSLHGGGALAANFTFALRFLPERFHPHAPDVLQCLELRYKVDWPLNIVITDNCMSKYNRLFSFLLQLKHMVWTLRDVWFHLKRAALVKGASHSTQFRQLQLYRHEMQHFVKVIQGYIANQILQVSWSEFIHKLDNVSDLDSIHNTHADYLNRAIFRGLLTEKATPVMNIIHSIFSLILKFRAQLIAQPWSSQQGETVHPSFVAMQQSYNTFKYYSHFLFKVVTKLVNRGYQPHLEDFLLRINFNNYYKDSVIMSQAKEYTASMKQVESSKERMAKLRRDGTELVTNIQVAADFRETQRGARQKEATRRRLEKLETQANKSLEKFEEISKGWDTAVQKNFTHELQEALDNQQKLCTLLLEDKDKLIHDLQQALKTNYGQYKKDLKKQAQDVNLLIEKMEEQIKNLTRSYRKELDLIETAFDQDRNTLLSSNHKKWEQMAKERNDKELQYLLQRMKKVEEYEVLLQQLRIEDAEEYNKIKIKLDTDVQILKQDLKQLKVTLQQNQEKLEYNFQVLKKREEENTITKCQQKRKINRLQDVKNNLKIRCEKQGKQSREEYKALGDDYKRIMQEYEDMQKKMRHFVTTDARTFKDIWLMNESEVKELVERALQTDRLVHEQQLAIPWVQPPLPFMEGDPTKFHRHSHRASRKNLLKSNRDDAEAAAYWEAMANIIPESKLQIWSALETALEKYYIALNERAKLLVETQTLHKQNMELKILLQQCISSKGSLTPQNLQA